MTRGLRKTEVLSDSEALASSGQPQPSNDSVVGPDDIHYQMLKHLPSEVLNTLLSILNDMVNR